MSAPKMKAMLQLKEQTATAYIDGLEKQIRDHHMHVSRDQVRAWNKRIQALRSLRIAIRTMLSMVD